MGVNPQFWQGKKVLLTGHTGFKGTWLALWLQELGALVCGIALLPETTPSLFTLTQIEKNIQHHIHDIRDYASIKKIMDAFKPDIVIHLAAQPLVRYSYQHPLETYETNVMGTANILEAAKTCQSVKVVVNVTTDKCYENREWHWGYRENDPMGGLDPYSSSKGCSELITNAYYHSFYQKLGKGLASARAGNVIGGGDWSEDRLIADVMRSIVDQKPVIIRNPTAIRPWQHVLESLSGYLLLAQKLWENPAKYSEGWNFGPYTRETVTVEMMVEKIFAGWQSAHCGWEIQQDLEQLHEAHFLKLEISKATTKLQWQPKLDLQTTIEWLVDWYHAWMEKKDMHQFTVKQIQNYQNLK